MKRIVEWTLQDILFQKQMNWMRPELIVIGNVKSCYLQIFEYIKFFKDGFIFMFWSGLKYRQIFYWMEQQHNKKIMRYYFALNLF